MRFISWNVNGLRACVEKGFMDFFNGADADFVCLQETKLQPGQISLETPGYLQYWNSAVKKGYSGTAVFARKEPISVVYGMDGYTDDEGRLITLEYPSFYLICCYSPNAQEGLARIGYRMDFEDLLRA
nr:endonuclease/exonuclease/phosphatase family protein [Eubacteriales bacterium]